MPDKVQVDIDRLGAILQKLHDWGYECGSNQASDWAWELKLDPREHISLDNAAQEIKQLLVTTIESLKLPEKKNAFGEQMYPGKHDLDNQFKYGFNQAISEMEIAKQNLIKEINGSNNIH